MNRLEYGLLHRQILPGTNRFVYWLKTPIGWLVCAAIAAALAANSIAPQMWMIFGVLLVLIILGTVWPMLAIKGISCELRFDRKRASENESVKARLVVTNKLWFPIWGLSLERGFFAAESEFDTSIAVALAKIPAAATSEFQWTFEPQHRGVYPLENPVVSSGFPFGLWFATKEVKVERAIIVWPETYPLGSMPPVHGSNQLVSETFTDQNGTTGDKIGVRPFQDGDSLRLVHWGQTARFDKLMVCERQSPSRQTVDVVVDLSPSAAVGKGARATELNETCLRIGASICAEFHSHGYHVRFQVGKALLEVDARIASNRRLMDRLAELKLDEDVLDTNGDWMSQKTENGFVVTTRSDVILNRRSNWKPVIVKPGIEEDASPNGWLIVESQSELKSAIAKNWIKACQTSWQVNG